MQVSDKETILEELEAENGEIVEGEVVESSSEITENEIEVEAEEPSEPPTIEEQLAAAQAEAEDYKDKWLRSQAEFANARKRMEKQRVDLFATATADVIKKLLPILDDYDRAMASIPETIQDDSWLEGIQLVQKKIVGILDTFNVTAIEAVGQPFDPNVHEAISQEPTEEFESGIVCKELQRGYKIGERVIRPSLVIVAE